MSVSPDVSWYEDVCPARGLKALEALDPRGHHLSTDDKLDAEYIRHRLTKPHWIQARQKYFSAKTDKITHNRDLDNLNTFHW